MNINRAYHLAAKRSLGYANSLREEEPLECHRLFKKLLEREFAAKRLDGNMVTIPGMPCHVCVYYPRPVRAVSHAAAAWRVGNVKY